MRIYGPNGTTLGSPAGNIRRTSSSGFSLPEDATATAETRATVAPKASANIDALLAMQGIEDPVEKRKRSVQRGKGALDVLDDLKLGLLSGNFDASTVNRLRAAAANLKSSASSPGSSCGSKSNWPKPGSSDGQFCPAGRFFTGSCAKAL